MLKHIALVAICIIVLHGLAFADDSVRMLGGGDKGWDGWTSTGTAWHQTTSGREANPHPAVAHMESGEDTTGTFRSPGFTVDGDVIEFWANGWDSREGARGVNKLLLRLAKDDSVLRQAAPPQQDAFSRVSWFVSDLKRQQVYFEAIDGSS